MIAGWQITAAVALGASLVSFGAGYTIRGWKCESALLAQQEADQKAFNDQLAHQNEESAGYEQDKAAAHTETVMREEKLRVIYQDRPVAVDCAAPDDARLVLDDAVQAANARAAGKSGAAVPGSTEAADPTR